MADRGRYERLMERFKEVDCWYLYGAGIVAYNLYTALSQMNHFIPQMVIVSKKSDGVSFFRKDKVYEFSKVKEIMHKNALIIVATPEETHIDIRNTLERENQCNYVLIDSELEYQIMSRYLKKNYDIQTFEKPIRELCKTSLVDIGVYMVKTQYDKIVKGKYELASYINPIQAGAQICSVKICEIRDDTGENISWKNRNYCELTAAYWVWKNTNHDYQGICHYRRFLNLPESIETYLSDGKIDMIVPLPFVCEPDISLQYLRYISKSDYQYLLQAIKDISLDDYDKATEVFCGRLIYNYNLIIAKREIYNDYCSWIFRILRQAEKYCDPMHIRQDRYAGYLGELLTTLYIIKNRNRLNIVHAKKIWMV